MYQRGEISTSILLLLEKGAETRGRAGGVGCCCCCSAPPVSLRMSALDSWEVENPVVSSLEGDAAGVAPGTVDGAGIMFNNYTKNVVQDEQSNAGDARNEDERTRPAAKRNRKSRGSDAGTSAPSSARSGSKRPRPGSTGSNASATSASLSRPNSRSRQQGLPDQALGPSASANAPAEEESSTSKVPGTNPRPSSVR